MEGNIIKVWLKSDDWDYGGNGPSDRELVRWNIGREEHNRLYRNDPDTTPVDMSGGHYETIDSLRVANIIVEALNLAAEATVTLAAMREQFADVIEGTAKPVSKKKPN